MTNSMNTSEAPSQSQLDTLKAILECSDEVQVVVRAMVAVARDLSITELERKRAWNTIKDALQLHPHQGQYGMDLVASEQEAAVESPQLQNVAKRLDAQETLFAERLREIMTRKCVSQIELAEKIGCSQSAIAHMLQRKCRPQKKTIMKLATALQIEAKELWPDLEVAEILDSVADFQEDRDMTPAEAELLRAAAQRQPSRIATKSLPSRKR